MYRIAYDAPYVGLVYATAQGASPCDGDAQTWRDVEVAKRSARTIYRVHGDRVQVRVQRIAEDGTYAGTVLHLQPRR